MSEPYPPATGRPEPPGRLTQRTDSLTEAGELLSVRVCDETTHTSVIPVGELDLSTAGAFDHWVWQAQTRSIDVVVDLRALVFIDSVGLRSLLAARLRAARRQGHLKVICTDGQVRRMLLLSGLDQLIDTVEPLTPVRALRGRRAAT
jgi:anti-anti-sigma factor